MTSTTLSNGIIIKSSPTSPAGYLGVSVPKAALGSNVPYYAVARRGVENLDPRFKEIQPNNHKITIGYFDDPLKAAYAVAVLEQDPKQFFDSGLPLQSWAKQLTPPADLAKLPVRPYSEVEQIVINKERKERGQGGNDDKLWGGTQRVDTRSWREFLSDTGITGKKLLTFLVQNELSPRDKAAQLVAGLQRLPDAAAVKSELAAVGVDLDNSDVISRIVATEPDPRLAESQELLDRIKHLIKY